MRLNIEDIINEYGYSLFKICLGYSNTFEDAEDLLQDVFINVWKGLDGFRGDSKVKTWLFRITINTCLLKLRKKSIKTIALDSIDHSSISNKASNTNQSPSFDLIHQVIQELTSKDKAIILLYLEGFTHQEISNIAGITPNYVGVKINRIKQKLSNKLKHG